MRKTPILILSGFLGSGKTTFLMQVLKNLKDKGVKPAVIINEVGDINVDGQMIEDSVPMREMLSGCICCTIRGDLSMELMDLINHENPDFIIIEATGVANPIEILDTVTELALLSPIEICANVTIIDAPDFLHRSATGKGRTYRLMIDQIRCASVLVVNKTDLVNAIELKEVTEQLVLHNSFAPIMNTLQCNLDIKNWEFILGNSYLNTNGYNAKEHSDETQKKYQCGHEHEHKDCSHPNHAHHHSYDHLMVHSHYFTYSLDKNMLVDMFKSLPDSVYRSKGIFTDRDNNGQRILFQYAFKELELTPIQPQGEVQDVAVFIGEHFPKEVVLRKLEQIDLP